MRNTKIFLLSVTAILLLSSCELKCNTKPLVGGIREHVEKAEKDVGDMAIDGVDSIAALEVPAALTTVPEQILKRTGYTVSYNKDTRLPNWVAWRLTDEHTEGTHKRPNKAFHEDEEVPEPRATDWDYYSSGYDRGHMCPAADNKWSGAAMYESFLFTNICPQNHNLNVGDWNEMENQCRRWAKEYGEIYIVCGPILYKGKHKTIGDNKVVVPEAFFKVVLRTSPEPQAIGFIYKNMSGDRPKGDYMNTVDEVERITGIDFFPSLPDDVEDRVEAECSLEEWM